MIRFIEVLHARDGRRKEVLDPASFSLGEVWINEQYVVKIQAAPAYQRLLEEGQLPEGLASEHSFTTVTTHNGGTPGVHVVVGDVGAVAKRLRYDKKTLLKG